MLEPVYRRVWEGEGVVLEDSLLPVLRNGSIENAWWNVIYTPIRGASGAVEGTLCSLAETTAKMNAANALQAIEEQQRLTLQLVPATFWWADPAGHIVNVDQRWKE